MKKLFLLLLSVFWVTCTSAKKNLSFLSERQPYVSTERFSQAGEASTWTLKFSAAMDPTTLHLENIFIVPCADIADGLSEDWQEVAEEIVDNEIVLPVQSLEIQESNQIQITLENSSTGIEMCLIALPKAMSLERVPLNQKCGGSETEYYVLSWHATSTEIEDPTTDFSEPQADTSESDEIAETLAEEDIQQSLEPATPMDLNGHVWITEVVTDPQRDHNESTASDGILFNSTPGTGAITTSDEYIEIFNGTDSEIDLSNWKISMQDSSAVEELLSDNNLDLYFSQSGSLTNWNTGEILVLGDPTGSLNNEIRIELLSDTGEVIDAIDITDANAAGTEDESFSLDEFGEWEMTDATPGEINFL